jgi:hypothetical protein
VTTAPTEIQLVGGMAIITFTLVILASFPSTAPMATAFAYLILVAILLAYGTGGLTTILNGTSGFLTGRPVAEKETTKVANVKTGPVAS